MHRSSVSTCGDDMEIPIKNSFVHYVNEPFRPRLYSAPGKIESAQVFKTPKVLYSVFSSPHCERPSPVLPAETTTLMVRNIPTRFTSVSFLRILDECGFRTSFDFFYLPMDFRTGKNMGYCFLNFYSAAVANSFAILFHGRRLRMTTSTKVIEVTPSRRQGLRENVALFKASDLLGSLSLPHFKPLVSLGGALRPLGEKTFDAVMA